MTQAHGLVAPYFFCVKEASVGTSEPWLRMAVPWCVLLYSISLLPFPSIRERIPLKMKLKLPCQSNQEMSWPSALEEPHIWRRISKVHGGKGTGQGTSKELTSVIHLLCRT